MQVEKILLSEILTDPMNPRKTFDEAELKELADNIKAQGLLQPITVRPIEKCGHACVPLLNLDIKYVIVCGERRYRACRMLAEQEGDKQATVLAIVRKLDDDEAFDAMITENLQRKDVDPIEEAFAFGQLLKKGSTAEEIAARFGKSVRFVQDRVKLNNLIPELMLLVREGRLPIVSAMMVSKLDEETQREFNENNAKYDNTSKARVMKFLDDYFMLIDHAPWYDTDDEEDENFDGGCNCKCAECQFNTANAGCLFWEMKESESKCTSRARFREKQIAWMYKFIHEHGGEMVGRDDELEYGKTVILDMFYGYKDDHKQFHSNVMESLADNGYKVVTRDCFDYKCCYDEDDERVQQLHKEGKVYRCINIWGSYASIEPEVEYWYLKKGAAGNDEHGGGVSAKVMKLVSQHTRNVELANEKMASEYRRLATDMGEAKRRGELNEDEQFALDCLILKQCGDAMSERYGLDKYMKKPAEVMEVVKNNQADRTMWYREFLRMAFSGTEMNFPTNLVPRLAYGVLADWKPKEAREIGQKAIAALEKKQQRIKEKLEALGYDVKGRKIEA